MANNLGLDLFVAGVLPEVDGGVDSTHEDLYVAGQLPATITDGHASGGGPGPGESTPSSGMLLLGVG
jgi:hypothetical protein